MKELTLAGLLAIFAIGWYREIGNSGTKESVITLLLAQGGSAIILLTLADIVPELAISLTALELLATVLGVGIQSGKSVKTNG